jgi:hypothetical protein
MALETRIPEGKPLEKVNNLNAFFFSLKVVSFNILSVPFV